MKLFTLKSGKVTPGAVIKLLALKGAAVVIPSVQVGETGRGRRLGVLPVEQALVTWSDEAMTVQELKSPAAEYDIGTTKGGGPKLVAGRADSSRCLVVLPTSIGFRGGNSHTGERLGYACTERLSDTEFCQHSHGQVEPVDGTPCPKCGRPVNLDRWGNCELRFGPSPLIPVVEGMIAEGDAGRMGNGEQFIAVLPKGVVLRTGYSGRLYGGPQSHYYLFDGSQVLAATWDERVASDVF